MNKRDLEHTINTWSEGMSSTCTRACWAGWRISGNRGASQQGSSQYMASKGWESLKGVNQDFYPQRPLQFPTLQESALHAWGINDSVAHTRACLNQKFAQTDHNATGVHMCTSSGHIHCAKPPLVAHLGRSHCSLDVEECNR